MSNPRPLSIVTGASSGLGGTFARKLAGRGFDLLLVARRLERLETLARELETRHGVHAEPLCADLADESQVEDVARRIKDAPNAELLVNNAGFGTLGLYHLTDYERQEEMVRVHVLATMRLTRAVLAGMIERRHGGIINVSSTAGFFCSAQNASYCGTKSWMNTFTESLRLELDSIGSPVKVQVLCPGFTYTEFHDVMGVRRDVIPGWLWRSADFVVEESLKGLEKGKLFVVPGWPYKAAVILSKLLPVGLRLRLESSSPHKRRVQE
jgi:short-subunit dehydrogenase